MIALLFLCLTAAEVPQEKVDLRGWKPVPAAAKPAAVTADKVELAPSADNWAFLTAPELSADVEVAATVVVTGKAQAFNFFGESWSVWPDPTYSDRGFEAGVLVRGSPEAGYRVQFSHALQEVTLVKYPDGGYLRSVPCPVELNKPFAVRVAAHGNVISVVVDEKEKIRYRDDPSPLAKGAVGLGASSRAKVSFSGVSVRSLSPPPAAKPSPEHVPNFSVRKWVGGRDWVFDGDEPVLLATTAGTLNNAKLRPGYKPQLSWTGHWETSNQGAFPDGAAKAADAVFSGGGKTLTAKWSAKNVKGRFEQRFTMEVGFDPRRQTYTYDVDSELEVSAGDPFHFKYGFDFEHHTPLDPFGWQYLMVRSADGRVVRRPVTPQDPGVIRGLDMTTGGARVWYGRYAEKLVVSPAVEYTLPDTATRRAETSVCAAFYDTGIAYPQDTLKAGTKVRARYRYTGYPAAEAEAMFTASALADTGGGTIDPNRHFIFADEWPKVTFSKFVPTSEPWQMGRRPFLSGHNQRPKYELERVPGVGSGFAMKLGPTAWAAADLRVPDPLAAGTYVVSARCKSDTAIGPGGRVELHVKDKTGKVLRSETHFIGSGSFDWRTTAWATTVPEDAAGVGVVLGNAGTGDVLVTDLSFTKLEPGAALPGGVLPAANATAPKTDPVPPGVLADYRMLEGKGHHVYNHAGRTTGPLELANVDWVTDEGRPALRFADNPPARRDWVRGGWLAGQYFEHPGGGYKEPHKKALPFAATTPDFDARRKETGAYTLVTNVKPAAEMGRGEHREQAHVVGFGHRFGILRLTGEKAPYGLVAAVTPNDVIPTEGAKLEAGKWYQLAVTGERAAGNKCRVRVYVDGALVADAVTKAHEVAKDGTEGGGVELIFGAEQWYLHAYYFRGLIGRTTVFDRALTPKELGSVSASK
ncbi:LamG-like jellyroll fold domain-containing protein [Gemmata sp.]|uniref:LamG-like jellyroll fold domain-containing protein n=1 Tax=Gemmata sp. TaxID=1914242 RepID=UPI003F71F5B2